MGAGLCCGPNLFMPWLLVRSAQDILIGMADPRVPLPSHGRPPSPQLVNALQSCISAALLVAANFASRAFIGARDGASAGDENESPLWLRAGQGPSPASPASPAESAPGGGSALKPRQY